MCIHDVSAAVPMRPRYAGLTLRVGAFHGNMITNRKGFTCYAHCCADKGKTYDPTCYGCNHGNSGQPGFSQATLDRLQRRANLRRASRIRRYVARTHK